MSSAKTATTTTTQRAAKPIKPKTAAKAVATETIPAEVKTEAVTASVATAGATTTPVAEEEKKNSRQQAFKKVGLGISFARCRHQLDAVNMNNVVIDMLRERKDKLEQLTVANEALTSGKLVTKTKNEKGELVSTETPLTEQQRTAFGATVKELKPQEARLKMEAYALSHSKIRFSQDASNAMAIVADQLIRELATHAINRALGKKKIIQVKHVHEEGVESLKLYPLVKDLPIFVETSTKISTEARKAELENAVKTACDTLRKELKRKYSALVPKGKKSELQDKQEPAAVVAAAEEPEEPAAPVEEEGESKTAFKHYIDGVCKDLIATKFPESKIRISYGIREYFNELLKQLIQRISNLVRLHLDGLDLEKVSETMEVKTVDAKAILKSVKTMLIADRDPEEQVVLVEKEVQDPEVLKAEIKKRDEAKEKGKEYKIDYDKVPKVMGLVAVRTVHYPESGYAELFREVSEKVGQVKQLNKETADSKKQ